MKADVRLNGNTGLRLVITPESKDERLLLIAWLRFDANSIAATVTRLENGEIDLLELFASEAR